MIRGKRTRSPYDASRHRTNLEAGGNDNKRESVAPSLDSKCNDGKEKKESKEGCTTFAKKCIFWLQTVLKKTKHVLSKGDFEAKTTWNAK